jgi:hypothetical protein
MLTAKSVTLSSRSLCPGHLPLAAGLLSWLDWRTARIRWRVEATKIFIPVIMEAILSASLRAILS